MTATEGFEFKKDRWPQYKSLYAQLTALDKLENIYTTGKITSQEHNEIIQEIHKSIQMLEETLGLLDDGVIKFAQITKIPIHYIQPALISGLFESKISGANIGALGQQLGNLITGFYDIVSIKNNKILKSSIHGCLKSIIICLQRLKISGRGEVNEHIHLIEAKLSKYKEDTFVLSEDDRHEMLLSRGPLMDAIYRQLEEMYSGENNNIKKGIECGAKHKTFFDAVSMATLNVGEVRVFYNEFYTSLKKFGNFSEKAEIESIFLKYSVILGKYDPSEYLSNEDREKIQNSQGELAELLFPEF
ncbi:hypothetical protein TRFO_40561 [Tritrichomonas foetus]|uniref:Uncharacterized protein n=1 Tax=Tritrichomonas foetus TaxID=1144522 RepID=A0A1J4J2Z5_9EUKA|nr:hypothetical protein TRFO_40561 [Tritrichomonas foetus]|eukprot:OHS93113.1 hypothetical protein TRFO_40561 [Tritrichomonas foetus]